jgi:preprotein translocase subunit SecA
MYQGLLAGIQEAIVTQLFRVPVAVAPQPRRQRQLVTNLQDREDARPRPVRSTAKEKLGRNDPCWCGSGKKYKLCHYRQDQMERQPVAHGQVKQAPPTRRRH